jgi:hypothetical protein
MIKCLYIYLNYKSETVIVITRRVMVAVAIIKHVCNIYARS